MNRSFEVKENQPNISSIPSGIIPRKSNIITEKGYQDFLQVVNIDRDFLEQSGVESIFKKAIKDNLVNPNETLSLSEGTVLITPTIEFSVNNPDNSLLSSRENRLVYIKLIFDKKFHQIEDCVGFTQSEVQIAVIDNKLNLLQPDGQYRPIEKEQLEQTIYEAINNPVITEKN